MATNKAEALANLEMLRDGIEHHTKIGAGTREIWLGWLRVAMRDLEGSVIMKCEDCGDTSRRSRNSKKCDICGGDLGKVE